MMVECAWVQLSSWIVFRDIEAAHYQICQSPPWLVGYCQSSSLSVMTLSVVRNPLTGIDLPKLNLFWVSWWVLGFVRLNKEAIH